MQAHESKRFGIDPLTDRNFGGREPFGFLGHTPRRDHLASRRYLRNTTTDDRKRSSAAFGADHFGFFMTLPIWILRRISVNWTIANGHGWIGSMAERRNTLGTHSFIRTFVERPIENWILNIGRK
jgi:hypothetical protein